MINFLQKAFVFKIHFLFLRNDKKCEKKSEVIT